MKAKADEAKKRPDSFDLPSSMYLPSHCHMSERFALLLSTRGGRAPHVLPRWRRQGTRGELGSRKFTPSLIRVGPSKRTDQSDCLLCRLAWNDYKRCELAYQSTTGCVNIMDLFGIEHESCFICVPTRTHRIEGILCLAYDERSASSVVER